MGMPLLAGRDFTERDTDQSSLVAIVDPGLAHRFFPGENPMGKRIHLGFAGTYTYREIIGVVADVHHEELGGRCRF